MQLLIPNIYAKKLAVEELNVINRVNQKIAKIKAPNIEASVIKSHFSELKRPPILFGTTGDYFGNSEKTRLNCKNEQLSADDLISLIKTILAKKNRLSRFFDSFRKPSLATTL